MSWFSDLKTKSKVCAGVSAPLVLMGIVGVVALTSIGKITYTADWVDHTRAVISRSEAIVASAVDMETGMRGYLLAGREAFLEPYELGKKNAYSQIGALKTTVGDNPSQVARLTEAESVLRDWQSEVAEPQIAMRREISEGGALNELANIVGEARGKQFFDKFRSVMDDFSSTERALMEQRKAANASTVNWTFWTIITCMAAAVLAGLAVALKIGASIANPISAVAQAMRTLADGSTDVEIDGCERGDEVGEIARATQVFKENAIRMQELARAEEVERAQAAARQEEMTDLQSAISEAVESAARGEFGNRVATTFQEDEFNTLAHGVNDLMEVVDTGLGETGRVLARIASGDLKDRMRGEFHGAFAELQRNVNETVDRLSDLVSRIASSTASVRGDADGINANSQSLSTRTTQQASSLEETAATM